MKRGRAYEHGDVKNRGGVAEVGVWGEGGYGMTEIIRQIEPKNPGINRLWSDRTKTDPRLIASDTMRLQEQVSLSIAESEDPLPHFLIGESEWHAREGINKLRNAPFVAWGNYRDDLKISALSQIYPREFVASQASLEDDVRFVIAAVRQAKEYYGTGMTVSELTRPTLMYYSAVMLAKALAVAVFASEYIQCQTGHGLRTPKGGVDLHGAKTQWPTFVKWQGHGDFVSLYHATRWDRYWADRVENDKWPTFHILECLRSIEIIPSHEMLKNPLALYHLMWSHLPGQPAVLPTTVNHVTQTPAFEVPRVVVFYMVLFWFGVMARYHPATWQELLTGKAEEGYFFRLAIDAVPRQFVRAMQEALPSPYHIDSPAERDKVVEPPNPQVLQRSYELVVNVVGNAPGGSTKNED